MTTARIGLVGCGFMGRLHAAALAQSAGAAFVAAFDADPAAAARTAEAHGTRACTSLDELLAMDLEGVVVATPDHAHRESVVRAAQAGLGVLVEKPLATRLDDADAMIAATDAAGVPLLVGHILRYETAYANLREAGFTDVHFIENQSRHRQIACTDHLNRQTDSRQLTA